MNYSYNQQGYSMPQGSGYAPVNSVQQEWGAGGNQIQAPAQSQSQSQSGVDMGQALLALINGGAAIQEQQALPVRPAQPSLEPGAANAPVQPSEAQLANSVLLAAIQNQSGAAASPAQEQQQPQQQQQQQKKKKKQKQPKSPRPRTTSPKRSNSNGNGNGNGNRDPIVVPSAASGGVPQASIPYLLSSSMPPARLAAPKPILVVIDLNGTLLHRPDRQRSHRFAERPHARTFLRYCVDTFWVVIWSSARPANVATMSRLLLAPADLDRVLAVWGRDRFGLSPDDYARRVQCYKRLATVWQSDVVQRAHPAYAQGVRWSQADTVLVDDSAEKARTEPHNLIETPEFVGAPEQDALILPQVHDLLNELSYQKDISSYLRANPFKPIQGFSLGS